MTEVDGRAPAEPLGAEEAAERRAAIVPMASRRASLIVGGLAAVAVAVVLGIWALAGDDPTPPRGAATPLHFAVEFEAETAEEVQRIPYPNPGRPEVSQFGTQMVAGQGAVWVEDSTAYVPSVLRVDPVHGDVDRVIVRGNAFTLSLAEGLDAVWVSSNRFDPDQPRARASPARSCRYPSRPADRGRRPSPRIGSSCGSGRHKGSCAGWTRRGQ